MNKSKLTKLNELIKVCNGYAFESNKFSYIGNPIIKIKNVSVSRTVDTVNCDFYPDEYCTGLDKYILNNNDILISMTGSQGSIGKVSRFKNNSSQVYYLNQRVGRIEILDDNILNAEYLFQVLSLKHYENRFFKVADGSGQPNLSPQAIGLLEIPLPDLLTQKKIANLLSSLDNKIEINNKINQELEELGQSLYTKWFVNFDFPNEEGKPYKSSGGEMIESELGMIPKGWKVGNISDVFDFEKGVEPGSSNYTNNKDDIRFIRVGDMQSTSPEIYVSKDIVEAKKLKYISNKDITISLDGTIGKVFVGNEGCISSGIRVIRLKGYEDMIDYTYLFAKSKYLINSLTGGSSGSVIKHAGGILNDLKIVHPDTVTLLKFQDLYSGIVETIIQNRMENKKLEELRDFLIPQLMSGNLEIKDIDNTEKEV